MAMRDYNIKTTLSNQHKNNIFQSLPLLPENAVNLKSSPPAGLMHPSLKEEKFKTDQWAFEIRQKIQTLVNQNENIPKELLFLLKNELVQVFIKALQEDSSRHWTFLYDVLQLLVPLKNCLEIPDWDHELQHYMKRIWSHLSFSRDKLYVDILEILKQIFPSVILYVEKEADFTFPKSCPKSAISPRNPSTTSPKPSFLKNNMDIFSTKITLDEDMSIFPKALTVLDLHRSIGSVAYDIAAYESFWGSCHGLTAQAVNVNLPEEILEEKPKSEEKKIDEKPAEDVPGKKSKSPKKVEPILVLSGREAVEYYIKRQFLQKVEHLYFNLAPSHHFKPYHLVSVPKDKVNPEYYLFSSFGVLHVDKDLQSETFRLTEWQRHAVLWEAIHEIPFFKNYLISKMFRRWKTAQSYLLFLKTKETLERLLLQSMPIYEAGLLQVSKLLNELVTIDFLPFQADKSYTLPEFEEAVFQVQSDTKGYLKRFFRLCKIIVDVIMFESFKKLRFCEEQMTAKNMFSRDSLYLMKMKKKQRTTNFLKAKNETSHLGNFVLLINQMTVEYLFTIAKSHIHKFLRNVLRSKKRDQKKGFFCIKLIYNDKDELEFSPSIEKCQEFLDGTLHGLASVLCSKAVPLGVLEIARKKSDEVHHDIYDSSEAIKKYIKQFLSANPQLIRDSPDVVKDLPFVSQSPETLEDQLPEQIDLDKLQKAIPTKSEDDWGVATPDNIQRQHSKKFQISGEGFLGQYTPLFTSKLEEKLLNDPQYMKSVNHKAMMLSSAKNNLDKYLNSLRWLETIYKTCKYWTTESLSSFKNLPPQDIEQKLGELNTWGKKVREMDVHFITKNQLFSVDSIEIYEYLIPRLDSIYQQLLNYVLTESKNNSVLFCKQIHQMAKALEGKPDDVKDFAEYVHLYNNSKIEIPEYKDLVDYTKAIFEIVRTYHRPLTDEEFQHENNLWVQWEVLQVMMQNVSEFVITQSPIMERQLEEMFKKLKMQASNYCEEASSGKFLDPNQNPSEIVNQIKKIQHKFHDVQQKLLDCTTWKKNIYGESFDLSFLHEIALKMDARYDLWKYRLNTIQSIDGWMVMPFKEMNVSNAVTKINEWKNASAHLKSVLPPGDLVLEFWEQCLDNFLEPLPLLQIISSDHHKSRHWKAIFNGMSAVYTSNKKYLVQELLSLDLIRHRDLIMSIHQLAIAEYDLEQRVKNMKKIWEDKMFKLLKYFPDSLKSTRGRSRKPSDQYYSKNIISEDDDYYILIEMEQLKTDLMDDSIILATMLSSSYLGDMKSQVEHLASALYQVEEIIDLWASAQKKWMFLVKIFEKPEMVNKYPLLSSKFEVSVHSKFKEWMRIAYADSKVLSVATRSITEKGYRFLQGEQLRKMFLNIIESMDNILESLRSFLDEGRMMFPRLFFLSDNELVEVLSISDDPHELPGVHKCFPGIDSITFTVLGTNLMSSKVAASELAINAHRLITIGIEGKYGEQVQLLRNVGPMKGIIQWLCDLEASMKDTMVENLSRCVEEKFKSVCIIQPSDTEENTMTFSQWIKAFPIECLRLAEAITWEKQMAKYLETENRPAATKLMSDMEKQISNLCHQPKTYPGSTSVKVDNRKYYVLSSLIVLWISLRDVTQVLLKDKSLSLQSFEWQTALKYHISYMALLRAETEQELIPSLDPVNNDFTNLTRTKTTVKTLYKFSKCVIHHLAVRIPYEYEYLGPRSVFLNTPLTEKAILSLTHSLKNYQCGAIVGPSSVGKTETVREFSRAFGQCMFHIKCSEMVSSFQVKQYMIGLITSGCWALFDDVNRLTKDMICTISQYLDQVQTALRGLQSDKNSQYGLRGQSKSDKKPGPPHFNLLTRRNSLTTLHALEKEPTSEDLMAPLNRQRTVPHGFNDKGLITFFGDEWVSEKNQRSSSIYEFENLRDLEFYQSNKPPALDKKKRFGSMKTDADSSQIQNKTYNRLYIGNIKFDGQYLQACASYGCFMTLNTTETSYHDIPDNFRLLLRPFSLLTPDYQRIAQVYCLMYGFNQYETLSKKLIVFINLFQTWLPQQEKFQGKNLSSLKSVMIALRKVKEEFQKLEGFDQDEEKQLMIEAIKEVFIPHLDEGRDKVQFWNLLQDVFGYVPQDNTQENQFRQALQNQLKENHFQINPIMVSKMVELFKSCSLSLRSTIVCGPCGSGKTLILKTLIQTLNMLNYKAASITKPHKEFVQKKESEVLISKANQKIKSRMQLLQQIISNIRPPPSTLNKAILKKKNDNSHYPRIYMSHLFPCAMEPEEFLGHHTSNGWQSGFLWQMLHKLTLSDAIMAECDQNKQDPIADTQVWLVLDGTLHSSWCDPISSLFDSSRKLILPNAETFILNDETKLIVETDQLSDASPAMLNQCSVIFCSPNNFQWESLFSVWIEKIKFKSYMSDVSIILLEEMANDMIPATLQFLRQDNGVTPALLTDLGPLDCQPTVVGLQEMTSFLRLLSILLEKALIKENSPELKSEGSRLDGSVSSEKFSLLNYRPDEDIPFYIDIIKGIFVFSFIWGFGAHLHERNKHQYSEHVRQCLYEMTDPIHFPSNGTVFDYWVDEAKGGFYPWAQKVTLTGSYKSHNSYVLLPEFQRYNYLIKLLLDNNIPILVSGNPGVGKTVFIKNTIFSTKMRRHCMSPLQTPKRFLEVILLREQWSGVGTRATSTASKGKTANSVKQKKTKYSHILFIDDLNMAQKQNGYQPTLELLRQILTIGTVFDNQQRTECNVEHLNFMTATTLPSAPGAGLDQLCHVMSSRLSRLFFNITFHTPTYDQLDAIYSCTTFAWLDDLPKSLVPHTSEMAKAITQGTLDLYLLIKEQLPASPAHPFYIFTLHDLAHVFDGITLFTANAAFQKLTEYKRTNDLSTSTNASSMCGNINYQFSANNNSRQLQLKGLLVRLWAHECNRSFADRILDKQDHNRYLESLEKITNKYFCQPDKDVCLGYTPTPTPSRTSALNMAIIEEEASQLEITENSTPDSTSIIGFQLSATIRFDDKNENEYSTIQDEPDSEIDSDHETCTETHAESEEYSETSREQDTDQQSSQLSVKAPTSSRNQSKEADSKSEDSRSCQSLTPTTDPKKTSPSSQNLSIAKKTVCGALMDMEDIKNGFKSFDEIIFSRYILYSASSDYTECSISQLIDALRKRISRYNSESQLKWDMALLEDFIPLITKLTRILTFPQGHGLLFRSSCKPAGRKALTKLAAYLAKAELIEPCVQDCNGQNYDSIFHQSFKQACHQAGVVATPTVLLIPEIFAYNCDLTNVSTLLAQGDCPLLYEEASKLSHMVQTAISEKKPSGTANKLTDEQMGRVYQILLSRVKQNLHILIFLTLEDSQSERNKLNALLERYPNLLKHSCSVTIQPPLSTSAYQQLTLEWIKEEDIECLFLDPLGNGMQEESVILSTISAAMAYIHQTAQTALMRQVLYERQIFPCYTVNHLRELVHMFKQIVMFIIQEEKENISHYAGALGKVNEAYGSINDYKETICRLSPQHKTAVHNIQDNISLLSKKREAYKKLLELNKEQDSRISKLQKLKKKMLEAQKKMFVEVEPEYRAALQNLKSVDKIAWYEVKKYRQPPEPIKKLLGAICLLFGRPVTWEEGMSLMSDSNFMNNIIYYNKSELNDEQYYALQKYIVDSDLKLQTMSVYSMAALSVCQWIFSIYRYATIARRNQPMKQKLKELESKLTKANMTLGKLRKETKFCKNALENHVKMCRESMKNAKALEKQIQNFEKKVADASHLMGNISGQHKMWKKEVNRAKQNIATAIGDGLLAAAYVCYCGPLDDQSRKKLLDEWLEHFEQEMFADVTSSNLYPKVYTKSFKCNSQWNNTENSDSDFCASVQAYEGKVSQSEFNYSSGLMTEANTESLDDVMDYDSDNEDETGKVLTIRKNFQLLKVLSSYEELSEWRMKNYPVDSRSLQNACIINMCKWNVRTLWPLLVDPDGQAELWIRNLHLLSQDKEGICDTDSITHITVTDASPAYHSNTSSTIDLTLPNDSAQLTLSPSTLFGVSHRSSDWSTLEKLCILPDDDPHLESKIWDAINYGQFLLVTHIGHHPLNPTILWLLSCHKVQITEYENTQTVLKNDKMTTPCHKDFFLFLSTNVPLNIQGFNFHNLPLEEINIIDMSLSNEAVMNRIIYETLEVEHLDFEKQRRANETDIIQHRQQLFHEFALIREKTMNLEGPLIEDKTILESLLACQRNVERNRLILDETCSKERHLEETYAPYIPMVIEAATIYSSLKNICQLYPCYFVSFDTFIKLFMNGLQSRNRGYGEAGEPKSRANELLNTATTCIFEFVSTMMFEEHLTVFYLGITLERLLQTKMATELEIGIFVTGFKLKKKKIESIINGKPDWISEQIWTECFFLEDMVPAFKGLRKSLHLPLISKQWQEYFKCPIILMNRVPNEKLKTLTIFQKSLLWKIFCPNRFSELCHSLIVSELGSLIIPKDNYNIRNVYKLSQSSTPVLFLLPSPLRKNQQPDGTQGSLYSDPVREVKRLAKELKMDGKVCLANCTSQLTPESLTDIVNECYQNNYWLILQNYHMCSSDVHLQLASILKIFLWNISQSNTSSAVSSKIHLSSTSMDLDEPLSKVNNFRLWVTFDSQQSNKGLPPACLIQQSVKVTCETSRNFKSTLLKCHRAAKFLLQRYPFDQNQYQKSDQISALYTNNSFEIMALAVLHSLLIQHRCFTYMQPQRRAVFTQPYHWSLLDMAFVSDFFCNWLPIANMQMLGKLADLVGGIYASHCTDEYDAAFVKAFVLDTLKTMYLEKQKAANLQAPNTAQPDTNSSGHTLKGSDYICSKSQLTPDLLSVLFHFTNTAKTSAVDAAGNQISIKGFTYNLCQKADSLNNGSFFSDVHHQIYGLPVMAQHSLLQHQSQIILSEISILDPYQSIFNQANLNLTAGIFQPQLTNILEHVTEQLNSLPHFPDISKIITLYPDENFLLLEIQNCTQLFHLITKQVEILKKHLTQQTGLTKEMLHVKKLISNNEIPTLWLSFSFPSNMKLTDWLKKTVSNARQLVSSVNHFNAFQPHDLTTFLRPDCLLSAIIQTYARKNIIELTDVRIEGMFQNEIDILPPGMIILTNASLCNAKWHSRSLQLGESSNQTNSKDEECTCTEGLLYLKITDKSKEESKQLFYPCPVFLSQEDLDLSRRNSMAEIPLPVTEDSLLFYGKKVHLHFSHKADV